MRRRAGSLGVVIVFFGLGCLKVVRGDCEGFVVLPATEILVWPQEPVVLPGRFEISSRRRVWLESKTSSHRLASGCRRGSVFPSQNRDL